MDRELDPTFRKKQIIKRAGVSALLVSLVAAAFVWGPGLITPSLGRARIRTARVDQGAIEATTNASGIVVPEFEQVFSSPVDARVLKILKRPGDSVGKGEPIVELDVSESVLALEKLDQEIELKQNEQQRARLDLENTLIKLDSQWEIKNLDYKSAKTSSRRSRELFAKGLQSEELLRAAELNEEKTRFELKQLEDAKLNAQASTKTQMEGLALEMKTLEKERTEARRKLDLATTKSDRDGVLTWVVNEEGATVAKGAVLARVADLTSFRVDATTSDIHAGKLSIALPVSVKINDDYLPGTISGINPTISNGIISFAVSLKDKASQLLRSNLRVDVLIVTDRKEKALRIKKGPFVTSEGRHDVFVVRGDTAVRTPVQIGISSFDGYEVVEGLIEGDEVIISDMSDYMHLKEVKLK